MDGHVDDIADAELIRRVIYYLSIMRGRKNRPLWRAVADNFALGSTYSAQLCRRFEFDPESPAS